MIHNQPQHLIYSKRATQRRGIALMLVMVAILVTGGMAVAYFGSRDNSIAISVNIESSAQARAVAETGLDLAIAILETDADWRTNHIDGVLLSDFEISGGIITITLMDFETSLPPTETTSSVEITVRATVNELIQTTKGVANVIPNNEEFDVDFSEFAIFSQSKIEIDTLASLLHWSASPLALQAQSLLIGTLSTNPMSVIINNPQQEALELFTMSNASSMLTTSSSIEIQEMDETPPYPDPPPVPLSGLELLVIGDDSQTTQLDIGSGTYIIDDNLSLLDGKTLVIDGNVTINVAGNLVLRNAEILINNGATLTMHIGGNVSVLTSYLGNNNQSTQSYMDPTHLQLFGHNETQWTLSGLTTLKGEIYAPKSEVEIRDRTTLCGRVAAAKVAMQGESRLLYDPTLNNGGFANFESSLYNNEGELHPEISLLTSLDPLLINEILLSISTFDYGFEDQYINDWLDNPTDRLHNVIYALIVYGVDTHDWEELASEVRWANDRTSFAALKQ